MDIFRKELKRKQLENNWKEEYNHKGCRKFDLIKVEDVLKKGRPLFYC